MLVVRLLTSLWPVGARADVPESLLVHTSIDNKVRNGITAQILAVEHRAMILNLDMDKVPILFLS